MLLSSFYILCRLQKFQKCEYAKTKLIKCEGRGWGLVALEDIKVRTPPYCCVFNISDTLYQDL